jgi:pilus assembly protein Flp/PilA
MDELKALLADETGVTAIEYALLAALIVIVASGSIALLGGGVNGMWTVISTKISAAL